MTPEAFLSGAPIPEAPEPPRPVLRLHTPAWEDRAVFLEPVNPWLYADAHTCPLPLEFAVRDRWCNEWAASMGGNRIPDRAIKDTRGHRNPRYKDGRYRHHPSFRGRS